MNLARSPRGTPPWGRRAGEERVVLAAFTVLPPGTVGLISPGHFAKYGDAQTLNPWTLTLQPMALQNLEVNARGTAAENRGNR